MTTFPSALTDAARAAGLQVMHYEKSVAGSLTPTVHGGVAVNGTAARLAAFLLAFDPNVLDAFKLAELQHSLQVHQLPLTSAGRPLTIYFPEYLLEEAPD